MKLIIDQFLPDYNTELRCGSDIILDSMVHYISSNVSGNSHSKECIWRIIVPDDDLYRVSLRFESFEVKDDENCQYNYVEIRNGLFSTSPLSERFCGQLPPNIYSIGRELFIKFVNNKPEENNWFYAKLEKEFDKCLMVNNGCEHYCLNTWYGYKCTCYKGFELDSDGKHCKNKYDESGTIDSSDCVNTNDTEEFYCVWRIVAPPRYRIVMNFTFFDLDNTEEKNYYDCPINSHIVIMNKVGNYSFQMGGPYCGTNAPPVTLSPKDAVDVIFHNNKRAANSYFLAEYYTVKDECAFNNGGCIFQCRKTINSFECVDSCHEISLPDDYTDESY
ncbi:dorsal-ventral patterning protein tolloid-like [Chelonus insularis]|uniref:dorsal-ventral patterning protein tolloid-like n=1 Tax=Chelonus insularis TaxID=460826 RepID=UPI00158B0DCA|nr:dorsal-ventral patterning protein tolloid-like [Chelonus insularis]